MGWVWFRLASPCFVGGLPFGALCGGSVASGWAVAALVFGVWWVYALVVVAEVPVTVWVYGLSAASAVDVAGADLWFPLLAELLVFPSIAALSGVALGWHQPRCTSSVQPLSRVVTTIVVSVPGRFAIDSVPASATAPIRAMPQGCPPSLSFKPSISGGVACQGPGSASMRVSPSTVMVMCAIRAASRP